MFSQFLVPAVKNSNLSFKFPNQELVWKFSKLVSVSPPQRELEKVLDLISTFSVSHEERLKMSVFKEMNHMMSLMRLPEAV